MKNLWCYCLSLPILFYVELTEKLQLPNTSALLSPSNTHEWMKFVFIDLFTLNLLIVRLHGEHKCILMSYIYINLLLQCSTYMENEHVQTRSNRSESESNHSVTCSDKILASRLLCLLSAWSSHPSDLAVD